MVARTAAGGFRTALSVGGHAMLADEPLSYGGTNLGPTPYDYLSAALASCTSMTLRMYADHKKLNFEAATVTVKHNKIHAEGLRRLRNDVRQSRRVSPQHCARRRPH